MDFVCKRPSTQLNEDPLTQEHFLSNHINYGFLGICLPIWFGIENLSTRKI